jgi:hypothetical protein
MAERLRAQSWKKLLNGQMPDWRGVDRIAPSAVGVMVGDVLVQHSPVDPGVGPIRSVDYVLDLATGRLHLVDFIWMSSAGVRLCGPGSLPHFTRVANARL